MLAPKEPSHRAPDVTRETLLEVGDEIFRRLVESVQDYAIFLLTPTGVIATWNSGAQRIKGYSAGEAIGQHFSIFYAPDALARGWPQEELRRALAEGRLEAASCSSSARWSTSISWCTMPSMHRSRASRPTGIC
jgi:PAS domain-containing protein